MSSAEGETRDIDARIRDASTTAGLKQQVAVPLVQDGNHHHTDDGEWTTVGPHVNRHAKGTDGALTDGNGVVHERDGIELHQVGQDIGMRDPQESHHRPVPAPLGEVESGEDSDCVVVASTERKVEPLKINLARDREPIRTIIKLTPGASSTAEHFQQLSPTIREVPGSPKITIRPLKPPADGFPGAGTSAASSSASAAGSEPHHTSNCAAAAYSSIPKLTIKPVINPADETPAGETLPADAAVPADQQMHIIPKLLIKGSSSLDATHGRDGPVEPHIVPKLTIRGVNNHNHHHYHHVHYQQQPQHQPQQPPQPHRKLESEPYPLDNLVSTMSVVEELAANATADGGTASPTPLVPKLTIKMDNHHHPHLHNSLRVKDAATDGPDAVGDPSMAGSRPEGPIPKLHIKTIQQDGVASIASSLSPGTSAGMSCGPSGMSSPPVLTSSEGVKLTIKPLPDPPKLPKLTIKTTGLGTVAETSDTSMVSSTSNNFSPKLADGSSGEKHPHHLLNAGLLVASQLPPGSPSDQHSNISSSSIPKLTIRPCKGSEGVPDGGSASSAPADPGTLPTVPRLTIKPILPPVKQPAEDSSSSSETSINSLESSPVSSSSASSVTASGALTTSPSALKMTIKVPSSVPQPAPYDASLPGVSRLNIKPIPPEGAGDQLKDQRFDASGDSTSPSAEESHRPIVIPKVTIKTLAHPRGQETEILSTPKVTLKPIPKPPDGPPGPGSPLERHVAQGSVVNNSGHSPTANNPDVMDSPRIILKINKGSSSITTTSVEQQGDVAGGEGGTTAPFSVPILANELKRPATSVGSSTATSSSSSSVSCASSTSVSASATSSSAGSDPASPSSGGGGDQGDPGSPEAKKSKLDHGLEPHSGLLRQSMLQTQHQFTLQELSRIPGASGPSLANNVGDVIVIDDDSKSESEAVKEAPETARTVPDPLAVQLYASIAGSDGAAVGTAPKARRTRGTPRGGGRQSRRGRGAGAVASLQQQLVGANPPAVPQLLGMLQSDDREDGSSSDCMIVDDPATKTATATAPPLMHGSLTLENLLRGGSASSAGAGNSFFGTVSMAGTEVDKNGTASNSSIGSVTSSVSGTVAPVPVPVATGRTPASGVRMSTRRATGQLMKEVLASKHQDRDSGVDEARTDGEGATPSKRPRGRPKKMSSDVTVETNGGCSSNSVDGNGSALDVGNNNLLLAMAMMGTEAGSSLLRPDGRALLDTQTFMEGIMPLPVTPARTPRTRGRGRGRGRGKMAPVEGEHAFGGVPMPIPFPLPGQGSTAGGNADPLFIGTPNNVEPGVDSSHNFHLLFNHLQTSRGGASGRTRGGRRGAGSRGPRTARGGGRGATKALAAMLASAQSCLLGGNFADLMSPGEAGNLPLDPLHRLPSSPTAAMGDVTPKPRGGTRGRSARGSGAAASKRKGVRGGAKSARGRKGTGTELMAAADALGDGALISDAGVPGRELENANNAIFMTPMAGGLDLNRPKLQVRELKTPKNAIKSNTPPSSAQATPSAGTTPSGTPGTTTPADGGNLQVFEEDTRMSGDFNFTTPVRLMSSGDGCLQPNDESQSSYLSSTSVTQDATNLSVVNAGESQAQLVPVPPGAALKDGLSGVPSAGNSNSSSRRNKGKMEVLDSHRAQFTVDLLAEYEWPPPSPGTKGTDTFMIQEQIAEYLGVKSFKRKYPDLMRRPVDMEERNFILEKGLASEKMCDLGLTAVYASEILDIMCTDYPEKYEEYTRYMHEKRFRDTSIRLQQQQQEAISAVAAVPIDRAQLQRDKAVESASNWNFSFNKERRDSRRACMDLQTYVVQVPKRQSRTRLESQQQPATKRQSSNYPVALVPGQFCEYYTTYTPEELACYPINTILLDPLQLQEIVSSERYRKLVAEEEARLLEVDSSSSSSSSSDGSSDSDSDDSSNDDSDSSDSSDDEARGKRSSITTGSDPSEGSSTDSECEAEGKVKSEFGRRKRRKRRGVADAGASPEASAGNAIPVRRSSRTMSAGPVPVPVVVPPVVECKEPTDSDDSDIPLIAHAVKKKNSLSAASTAQTWSSTGAPSAGGGKRMQETIVPVKRPPLNPFMCAVCSGPENKNKYDKPELFVRCNRCRRKAHPSCIGMSSVMYRRVQQYQWQCSECKLCMKCKRQPSAIDSKMVYCDQCDRGYHLACKGLRNLPEGRWHCSICTICGLCGAQTPEGHPNPTLSAQQRQQLAMVAEWTHEYGQNELTKIREHLRTLCVPCVRLRRQQLQERPPEPSPHQLAAGNGESIATLNNNNAPDERKPLAGPGMGMTAGVVVSMKPQSSSQPTIGGGSTTFIKQ